MPKFDDYWFDEHDGRPPYEGGHHGEPHEHPYDDYPHDHHPYPPFDGRRHRPVDMGKVDTTKMHDRYDMFVPPHMPPWGFKFPKLEKAFVPGSTPQEQVAYLLNRVDTMIDYFNHYDDKVWGAYNAVVHSALGNEAYYREITREEGYLADGSTPYTVIHIPYLDRADRPIFLELGLAYNNTTNNGVKENVFEASQNRVADKLIPAFNIADGWEGKAMLKGAPIQSTYTEGKFTLAVTDNGFLKIYPNTVSYDQLNRDRIRNAMGVQGVLINNGAKTPEQYATNGGELLARVGIGMNYETKERLIVIVNGNPTPPNDASVTGATADMLADIFAKYNCTIAVETANNGSAVAMDKGQMIYMPDTATTGVIPTVPSINCYWYITKRRHYHNQYVKDVADLIQKVGQNKWRCEIALQSCDFLKGRVNDLQRDLDAEVRARQDADEQLQNNIDAEAEARRLADEQLQDNIDAEAETRRLADAQLQSNIDAEANARRAADEQLQDNIDDEAETRRLADAQLQDNIDAEANARVAGDNALDERITNEVSILNTRINTVVEEFNNAIATERQARIDGDDALGTRIDSEVAAINARIDSEVVTINTRIDTEVATLNTLIDAEEQARIAGDTALQNSLTQLREDYTAFLTTYANDLAETRRITTTLRSDITTIQGQIAELQSNLSAVNASITAILATINTIEQSFENIKTAFTGLQEDWHDYKDSVDSEIAQFKTEMQEDWGDYKDTVDAEIAQLKQEWAEYKTATIAELKEFILEQIGDGDFVKKDGDTMTGSLEMVYGSKLKVSYDEQNTTIGPSYITFTTPSTNSFIEIDSEQGCLKLIGMDSPDDSSDYPIRIENVADPQRDNDAVNKLYVDPLRGDVEYYIDPVNGDDTNDGSSEAPFNTLRHFNDIAKRTVDTGSYTVHLAGGTYVESIILGGIPATVTLEIENAVNFDAIDIYNCNNVVIHGDADSLVFTAHSPDISAACKIVNSNVHIDNMKDENELIFAFTNSNVYIGTWKSSILDIHERFSNAFIETYVYSESGTASSRHGIALENYSQAIIENGAPADLSVTISDATCKYIQSS